MAEIKKKLKRLKEGKPYYPAGPDELVIIDAHTIMDIVRYLRSCCSSKDELQQYVKELKR
jgi:propanediol dehydratase small subunit